jgi:hypothetical protein
MFPNRDGIELEIMCFMLQGYETGCVYWDRFHTIGIRSERSTSGMEKYAVLIYFMTEKEH